MDGIKMLRIRSHVRDARLRCSAVTGRLAKSRIRCGREGRNVEIQEALVVIRSLANGINPEGGDPLPQDSVCRSPQTVRALNRAVSALIAAEERERNRPSNAGKAWSRSEDMKICEELRAGSNLQQIAAAHGRSVGSIVSRLVRLGKISAKTAAGAA